MRNASIKVLREIGVDTGGSNVQFAIDPASGRMVVIEMNPRVSRSSALASKATGFPIARVAAKLAVGYTLDEVQNDITKVTPASFEPTIDYVVTKIPRFTFEKFPETVGELGTAMKSVGEAMAIGRTFAESLQKALRSLETGLSGLDEIDIPGAGDDRETAVRAALSRPTPERLRVAAQALRLGFSIDAIHAATAYDPWFLRQLQDIVDAERAVVADGLPTTAEGFATLKAMGFADARLAKLVGTSELAVRRTRAQLGVEPVYKRIDTCAGEFPSPTPYLYGVYEAPAVPGAAPECEAEPSDRRKIVIIGGGPNRIGQGIEFDYCCVHAVQGLSEAGFETIMVNCNPETVSTDYDTADRLYFEPLTAEDVVAICRREAANGALVGAIVQLGGQTPLKLVPALEEAGIPVLGTPPDSIDLAEDRERFKDLLETLGLKQPANTICMAHENVLQVADRLGYPLVVRPSYVLGGRAMRIVHGPEDIKTFLGALDHDTEGGPILLDGYLENAVEVDVDVVADDRTVRIAGIMEHIEEAGIHSGDSACSLPPYSLDDGVRAEIARQSEALARALDVRGLMNLQLAIKDGEVYVLEVNPRASRTVPFVAKTITRPIARIAARVMAGEALADLLDEVPELDHVAVKEAVFPFARFPDVDLLLGPEMKSTGEVMGLDQGFGRAFAKSQIAAGALLPDAGTVFVSVRDADKDAIVEPVRQLLALGFEVICTVGTQKSLAAAGVEVTGVNKAHESRPNIVDRITDGAVAMVINTTEGQQAIRDSFALRRAALVQRVPYYTTGAGARAAVRAMRALRTAPLEVRPLQSYAASLK
jgi:carbamoyl-phosphate synthase large subunit